MLDVKLLKVIYFRCRLEVADGVLEADCLPVDRSEVDKRCFCRRYRRVRVSHWDSWTCCISSQKYTDTDRRFSGKFGGIFVIPIGVGDHSHNADNDEFVCPHDSGSKHRKSTS